MGEPTRTVHDALFSVEVHSGPDGDVVTVRGELDLATAPRLGEEIERRLNGSDVVLDLSEVPFIDSSGIRVLLEAARLAAAGERKLSVRCSPAVERALSLCGLSEDLSQLTSS